MFSESLVCLSFFEASVSRAFWGCESEFFFVEVSSGPIQECHCLPLACFHHKVFQTLFQQSQRCFFFCFKNPKTKGAEKKKIKHTRYTKCSLFASTIFTKKKRCLIKSSKNKLNRETNKKKTREKKQKKKQLNRGKKRKKNKHKKTNKNSPPPQARPPLPLLCLRAALAASCGTPLARPAGRPAG